MDRSLELPREREETRDTANPPAPEPETQTDAYIFDGWSYVPLKLAH